VRNLSLVILAGLALAAPASAAPTVKVDKVEAYTYRIEVTTTGTFQPDAALEFIASEAKKLCRDRPYKLTRYFYRLKKPLGDPGVEADAVLVVVQAATCQSDGTLEDPPSSADVRPEDDDGSMIALTNRYLDMLQRGEYRAAYDIKGGAAYKRPTLEEFTTFHLGQDRNGQITRFKVTSLDRRAPRGAMPGTYITVEYLAWRTNDFRECGILTWHRNADGQFRMPTSTVGVLPGHVDPKSDPNKQADVVKMVGCNPFRG
jgi:hypothetical protein